MENIEKKHCGLDINRTLKSFDKRAFPTFKEITTFVRASINLISEFDKYLLHDINLVTYADRIIVKYLNDRKACRLNNIFSKDSQTAEKSLRQILFQNGFISQNPNDVDEFCKDISNLSVQKAKKALLDGTFMLE